MASAVPNGPQSSISGALTVLNLIMELFVWEKATFLLKIVPAAIADSASSTLCSCSVVFLAAATLLIVVRIGLGQVAHIVSEMSRTDTHLDNT
jgi:hypothetical protein